MSKLRLQPFERGIYIDLSNLAENHKEFAREEVRSLSLFQSKRFIYSSSSLNMWKMFARQDKAYLIWTEDDRKLPKLLPSYLQILNRRDERRTI